MTETSKSNDLKDGIEPLKEHGHNRIKSYLKTLPNSPGVYRMLDEKGSVLYVGKAKNLKKRVASYARPTGHAARIDRMIAKTSSMMFLTTETENEALLLEQNLIKQLKPRYNILLRDDKSFPDIKITYHDFPQIVKHRGKRDKQSKYFGPFASAGSVNRTLNQLQRAFLLRECSDSIYANRTRPCLLYQIKRCAAPCVGKISKVDYAELVEDATKFLSGKSTNIKERLVVDMRVASADMAFERAAALRDRIQALSSVHSSQAINPKTVPEADILALYEENGQACMQVFFIRANQNWGNYAYFPNTGVGASSAEIMEGFIGQFYVKRQPPKQLILSEMPQNLDLITTHLSNKIGKKVDLIKPLRGEKRFLLEHAYRNAREALGRRMAESSAQTKLFVKMGEAFELNEMPKRVEVYDNSHIQGAHAVGAMIVSGPEGYLKSSYRKYNIKDTEITPGDDFGMMKEVLTRRLSRLVKEDPDRVTENWPDLLLIDGGAGQVSAVESVLADIGISDLPVVGVAKGVDRNAGKEEFYRKGQPVFTLARNDPVLYLIQRLRDEAHRFAIGTHRKKRAKALTISTLDDVPGVGASRKQNLLTHFGSAKAVANAGLVDLKSVRGISNALAETVYNYFHED